MKRLLTYTLIALLTTACASCGVKNDPQPPPGSTQSQ